YRSLPGTFTLSTNRNVCWGMADAFFVREGGRLISTELTRGPWSNEHQHGGPPAALLAGAAERLGPDAGSFRLVRATVEFLRPVPIATLEVDAEFAPGGNKVKARKVR